MAEFVEVEHKKEKVKYNVVIGNLIIPDKLRILSEENENLFFIIDKRVFEIYTELFIQNLYGNNYFLLDANEENKSIDSVVQIVSELLKNNFPRSGTIVLVGGGVTGDLGAFISSIYKRGIKFVNVPTTIISALDSSIGGKTGVNFAPLKNIIGSFYFPQEVIIDPLFFKSLPDDEIISGFGEMLKYGFLMNDEFLTIILDSFSELLSNKILRDNIVIDCINFKTEITKLDFNEKGIRKILNLGHTFAHGFESYAKFNIKHGVAVIIGIISSLYLSDYIGLITKNKLMFYLNELEKIKKYLPLFNFEPEIVYNFMKNDKKNKENKVNFVLLRNAGEIVYDIQVPDIAVYESIKKMEKFINE